RQAVHYRCQHAHVVAHNAVHPRFSEARTAEQVAAADYHPNLNTQFNQLFNLLRHTIQYARINTEAFGALQCFTTELEQNAFIDGFCIGSHVSFLEQSMNGGWSNRTTHNASLAQPERIRAD